MSSSSNKSTAKANLLGKREPKDDLETKPILKKQKEKPEEKETTEGFADSLQQIETKSYQANLISAVDVREKTLFVAHPRQTEISDIINFFKDVGEVVHVRLIVTRRGVNLGYGYVEFASANKAKKALEKKKGEYLHDGTIFVDVVKKAPRPPKYCIDHKVVWYEDYLQRESLLIKEDEKVERLFEEVDTRKKTLFVANLSPQTKISDIKDFFYDYGEVVSVRLIVNHEGKHVGCGFVEFATVYEAKKVLKQTNGEYLHDHKIFLVVAKIPPYPPRAKYNLAEKLCYEDYLQRGSSLLEEDETVERLVEEVAVREKTLFVTHSLETEISDIINFFKDVGEVVHVRLIVNRRGENVGYGFVEFASANEAKKALEKKHGEYLHDGKIFLDVVKTTPCPPKYCIDHKVWYEDYLRRESLLIEEDEAVEGLVEEVAARQKMLFVANLSPQTAIKHVKKFFQFSGRVVSVRLIVNHEGKRVGCGFVEFATPNEAEKALQEKNGKMKDGHEIFVDVAEIAPYPLRPKYSLAEKLWYEEEDETMEGLDEHTVFVEAVAVREKTLFVTQLSRQTEISHIINFFKDVGEVVHVRLIVNRRGENVGYGFVEFASANEAKKALEKKHGENLHDRTIFLNVVKTAPCPPKYCIDHNVWYEDYLRRESLLIEEDETVEGLVEEVTARNKTLFVANLAPQTAIKHVRQFFQKFGTVVSVRLIVNHEGKLVGCGFVEFASANEAKKVLQKKNDERLCTRKIFLDVAEIAPYPLRPKYNLAEKLWYEDYLRRASLLKEEDDLMTSEDDLMTKPIQFCGKKTTFVDDEEAFC